MGMLGFRSASAPEKGYPVGKNQFETCYISGPRSDLNSHSKGSEMLLFEVV